MELSNILSYAKDLKALLTVYDNSVKQLTILESKIEQLDQQIFTADIQGCQGYSVHLHTQKSVLVGVKTMFQTYKIKKWQEIQDLTALILQSHDQPSTVTAPTSQQQPDSMATSFTELYCAYSRTA